MTDPGLSNLLKWSIENSARQPTENGVNGTHDTNGDTNGASTQGSTRGLDPEVLAQLLGGPSDADLMKDAMAAIITPEVSVDNKLVAFDNFEQLIENLDNANNMIPLGLWEPLLQQLTAEDERIRKMAAWCVGTAVQNNLKSQEHIITTTALPTLTSLALSDPNSQVRRKATFALSSSVRNYQPALDIVIKELPQGWKSQNGIPETIDAADMEGVDKIIGRLREQAQA